MDKLDLIVWFIELGVFVDHKVLKTFVARHLFHYECMIMTALRRYHDEINLRICILHAFSSQWKGKLSASGTARTVERSRPEAPTPWSKFRTALAPLLVINMLVFELVKLVMQSYAISADLTNNVLLVAARRLQSLCAVLSGDWERQRRCRWC